MRVTITDIQEIKVNIYIYMYIYGIKKLSTNRNKQKTSAALQINNIATLKEKKVKTNKKKNK